MVVDCTSVLQTPLPGGADTTDGRREGGHTGGSRKHDRSLARLVSVRDGEAIVTVMSSASTQPLCFQQTGDGPKKSIRKIDGQTRGNHSRDFFTIRRRAEMYAVKKLSLLYYRC